MSEQRMRSTPSAENHAVAGWPRASVTRRKERITVKHLVSMSSGLDCIRDEDERTQREMKANPDWVQFAVDRPARWEPGTHFVYCSPGTHLLSAILQQATGMTALEFARAHLFAPLGIREVIWPADPQGVRPRGPILEHRRHHHGRRIRPRRDWAAAAGHLRQDLRLR